MTQQPLAMASQILLPKTPPESGECCLFKLPPELRVVIYQMAFEGLCFDGEEGLEDMTRDRMAKMHGESGDDDAGARGQAQITDTGDGAEDDEEDEADGATDEKEHEYTNGEDEIEDAEDNTQDESDAVNLEDDEMGDEEVDSSNGEDETRDEHEGTEEDHHQEEALETEEGDHDEVSSHNDADGDNDNDDDLDDSEASSAETEDEPPKDLHITRPPLLATCQQIRKEAIPVYCDALTNLMTKTLENTNETISQSKKTIDECEEYLGFRSSFMGYMLKQTVLDMRQLLKNRVVVIAKEIASIEESAGGGTPCSKEIKDRLVKATMEFRKLIFDVAGVDVDKAPA